MGNDMHDQVEPIGVRRQITLNAGAFVRLLWSGQFKRARFVGRGLLRGMVGFLRLFYT